MLEQQPAGRGRQGWHRLALLLALCAATAIISSCGSSSSSSSTSTPTVTVTCTVYQVTVLQTDQCSASVLNLSSTLVNWTISGTDTGSIDPTGLYKAPSTVPKDNVVTITATSQANTAITGTTTVTIEQATTIATVICSAPGPNPAAASTVTSGNQLDCTAATASGASVPVYWSVNNIQGGSAALGTISNQGVYTAPLVPPSGLNPPAQITITATSQNLSTNAVSVTATVQFGPDIISGEYVFSTSGRIVSSNAFFARAGSFTAGGGFITGGVEDTNQDGEAGGTGGLVPTTQIPFTGSYTVGPDGRGTMQFCERIPTPCPAGSTAATAFFSIVVVSRQQIEVTEFSQPGTSTALNVGSGEMVAGPPDASLFNPAGLTGTYSFNFAGSSPTAAPESVIGEFTSDGSRTLDADSASTPSRIDVNDSTAPQSLPASTYSIFQNGRGTATIGSSVYSFYIVSAGQAKFIEIDANGRLVGDAFKQQATVCTWGANALNGPTVFETGGTRSGVGVADLVGFTADGKGGITAAAVDEAAGGVLTSATSLTGSYTVDSCGRGTVTIPNHSYVLYMTSVGNALIQELTSGTVGSGTLTQPAAGPFTAASLNGSYALALAGSNKGAQVNEEEDASGQLTLAGASTSQSGTVSSGTVDVDNNADGSNLGATQSVTQTAGTTSVDGTTGRATVSALTFPQSLVLYIVSPTKAFTIVGSDNTGLVASGALYKQF